MTACSSSVGRDLATRPDSHALALPRHRKQANRCWVAWQNAPEEVKHAMLSHYDNRLARFYMWAQTECSILLALQMPTGEEGESDRLSIMLCRRGGIRLYRYQVGTRTCSKLQEL